jgi:hypothetical protein
MKPNSKQYPAEKLKSFHAKKLDTKLKKKKKKKKSFPQKKNTQLKNQIFACKNKILKHL